MREAEAEAEAGERAGRGGRGGAARVPVGAVRGEMISGREEAEEVGAAEGAAEGAAAEEAEEVRAAAGAGAGAESAAGTEAAAEAEAGSYVAGRVSPPLEGHEATTLRLAGSALLRRSGDAFGGGFGGGEEGLRGGATRSGDDVEGWREGCNVDVGWSAEAAEAAGGGAGTAALAGDRTVAALLRLLCRESGYEEYAKADGAARWRNLGELATVAASFQVHELRD